jgi:hypothetical protein
MIKITNGISFQLLPILKAQLHISASMELHASRSIILYTAENFSNASQLTFSLIITYS